MSDIGDFAERALSQFSKSITDRVFLMIQNDRGLMHDYLRLVEANGLDAVNQQLGKAVKNRFHLSNDAQRGSSPESTLLRSYQQFE